MKNMKDQSLLKELAHDSNPRSVISLLSESGFSIYGFSYLKLSSSWRPSSKNERNSYESY